MKVLRILFFLALCLMGFATHAEEVTYTVKAGDTLSKIALSYHTTVDTIVELNSIDNRDLIHPKQKLSINVSERTTALSAQKRALRSTAVVAIASPQVEVAKNSRVEISTSAVMIETNRYTCAIRPSGSPHCEEKAVLGKQQPVVPASDLTLTNPFPLGVLGVLRDTQTETIVDPSSIDTTSAITFSLVKDLFPQSTTDARTKRRASIRNFLRTYVGPPYDLARMEDVLLDAPFPSLTRNHDVTEESQKTEK